jgi:hypothetical protein
LFQESGEEKRKRAHRDRMRKLRLDPDYRAKESKQYANWYALNQAKKRKYARERSRSIRATEEGRLRLNAYERQRYAQQKKGVSV